MCNELPDCGVEFLAANTCLYLIDLDYAAAFFDIKIDQGGVIDFFVMGSGSSSLAIEFFYDVAMI